MAASERGSRTRMTCTGTQRYTSGVRSSGFRTNSGGCGKDALRISWSSRVWLFFFFQAEDGIRDLTVTGVQTCALPISLVEQRVIRHAVFPDVAPHVRPTPMRQRKHFHDRPAVDLVILDDLRRRAGGRLIDRKSVV